MEVIFELFYNFEERRDVILEGHVVLHMHELFKKEYYKRRAWTKEEEIFDEKMLNRDYKSTDTTIWSTEYKENREKAIRSLESSRDIRFIKKVDKIDEEDVLNFMEFYLFSRSYTRQRKGKKAAWITDYNSDTFQRNFAVAKQRLYNWRYCMMSFGKRAERF